MKGRRVALLIPILLAIAIPIGIARAPGRRSLPEPPLLPSPAPAQKARDSVVAPSTLADPLSESPSLPTTSPGWLRVRRLLPEGLTDRSFRLVIVKEDGGLEKDFGDHDDDHADLQPLTPGRKAVLLFSPKGAFETMTAVVTIAAGAESSLDLSPSASVPLSGEIADASGKPVSDLEVETEETLSYRENFVPKFSNGATGQGLFHVEALGRGSSRGFSYHCMIQNQGISLSRNFPTDVRGRFVLSAGPNQAAVPVRILREGKLLKEEVILASKVPLRLVVPGVAEPPKK